MSMNLSETERQTARTRLVYPWWFMLFCFGLLIVRFYVFQLAHHQSWQELMNIRQFREVRVQPLRGNIYDRNRKPLAEWQMSFDVLVVPKEMTRDSWRLLAEILGRDPEDLKEEIKLKILGRDKSKLGARPSPNAPAVAAPPAKPVRKLSEEAAHFVVATDVSISRELATLEINHWRLPGVSIQPRRVRKYNQDSLAVCHVLGYIREISREQLETDPYLGSAFLPGDIVGQNGVEKSLDLKLHGAFGKTFKLIDSHGLDFKLASLQDESDKQLFQGILHSLDERSLGSRRQDGSNVYLTIDVELQKIAYRRMREGGYKGAVVAMDVKTGEILCLLSLPGYDPNLFVGAMTTETTRFLFTHPDHVLLNRAIQSYPPASIFKIVVAAAALEEKAIPLDQTYYCSGEYVREKWTRKPKCWIWKRGGHGFLNLDQAIVQSCDVYFYRLGAEVLGREKIAKWAERFGLGRPTGIELPNEKSGLIPTEEYKKKKYKYSWNIGDTVNMAIGQGYVGITPLQGVLIPAAIANRGVIMKPQLIHHLEIQGGLEYQMIQPTALAENFLGPHTVEFLKRAMIGVVEDPHGTARAYVLNPTLRIGGKTGTAQTGKTDKTRPDKPPISHAWFIGFAPAQDPKIALTVFLEDVVDGSGGRHAGTIARDILVDYAKLLAGETIDAPIPVQPTTPPGGAEAPPTE